MKQLIKALYKLLQEMLARGEIIQKIGSFPIIETENVKLIMKLLSEIMRV